MEKNSLAKNRISTSTQQYLDIAEIKDDTIIMKDGSLRAILLVSSINFALKSEDEQDALISSYVSFLNNINFPIQITLQSRELNIDSYIENLHKKEKEQTNALLKMQTTEYIQYVEELISIGKIMSKRFYVTVPYNPLSDKHKNFFSTLLETMKPATFIKLKEEKFYRYKSELIKRVENINDGLASMGLNVVQLDTQSLIELFYDSYNPVTSKNQKMTNIENLKIS